MLSLKEAAEYMGEPVSTFRRRREYRKAKVSRPGERRLRYSRGAAAQDQSQIVSPPPRSTTKTLNPMEDNSKHADDGVARAAKPPTRETVWRGDRGEGSIFFRLKEGRPLSENLYLSYRADGKEQVVSTKTNDLADAKRELKRLTRNRENAREGKEPLITPKAERVTVEQIVGDTLTNASLKKNAFRSPR